MAGCATAVDRGSPPAGSPARSYKSCTDANRRAQAPPSSVTGDPWPGNRNPILELHPPRPTKMPAWKSRCRPSSEPASISEGLLPSRWRSIRTRSVRSRDARSAGRLATIAARTVSHPMLLARLMERSPISARDNRPAKIRRSSTCRLRSTTSRAPSRNNSASCDDASSALSTGLRLARRSWASDSSTTWALIPPKPMALTPARSGRSVGQGSAFPEDSERGPIAGQFGMGLVAAGGRGQDLGVESQGRLDQSGDAGRGLGVADVGLDRADRRGGAASSPAASRKARPRARSSVASPTLVPVPWPSKYGDCIDPEPRSPIGAPQRQELALDFGTRDPALTVGRDPPAADDGDDPSALGQRVGQPHQHDDAAAFARPETRPMGVEDPHGIRGQGPGLGEADQLERVEAQIHPARQGHVQVARRQRGTRVGQGQQATMHRRHRRCNRLPSDRSDCRSVPRWCWRGCRRASPRPRAERAP